MQCTNVIGDFSEDPGECPATTTCAVVCVAQAQDCPVVPNCTDIGYELCAETQMCSANCRTVANVTLDTTLCPCHALPLACPRQVDVYPNCRVRFATYYTANTACLEAQALTELPNKLSFGGPWFVVCYAYYSALAVAVVVWCCANQVLFPVPTSTVPMAAAAATSATPSTTRKEWTQTGYKIELVGSILDAMVELSFLLIQFLLLLTTLFYYTQQGHITRWGDPVFEDEGQVLTAFIMVWMIGIAWCFAFRYPSTGVQSLFLRRCDIRESAYVAVVAPIKTASSNRSSNQDDKSVSWQSRWAARLWAPLDMVLRTIFSYPYDRPGLETVFCPVTVDAATGTRSILHRMRRYVYDEDSNCFIPCSMSVGTTFGDLLKQVSGLSAEQASERLGRQGPNVIPLPEPSVVGSLYKEFSKNFYLYQNFCIWAYANYDYWYMALVYTVCRFAGAFVVVYFQHRSDSLLYNLSHVQGTAEYVPVRRSALPLLR
jgi:Cation transporter/ATPase, N-terminus